VHERRIAQEPEIVARMVRACVRGWQHYLTDPAPTNQHIAARNSEMSLEALAYGAAELPKLCLPDALDPTQLGTMSAARWEELAGRLEEIQLLDRSDIWSDAFDTRFLPPQPNTPVPRSVSAATP
jgi:NitT/TauT family transport system substrate-binding protein